MSRLAELEQGKLTPEQQAVVDAIYAGPRGGAPRPGGPVIGGPFAPLLRSPRLCDIAQQLGAYCRFETTLPPVLSEMAIIMTAARWKAQVEFSGHSRLAREAGLPDDVIEAIRVGAEPPLQNREQRALYAVVTEYFAKSRVSDAAYKEAVAVFGERGVVDIVGIVGYYCLVAMTLNVFDVELAEGVTRPFA